MKRRKNKSQRLLSTFIVVIMVFITFKVNAQDTIYLKDENPFIIAKILEVNSNNLKYRKYSNIEGPVYTIEKINIRRVVYQNGEIEMFSSDGLNSTIVERQTSVDLISGSKIFLSYIPTKDKDNVSGSDAIQMLRSYIEEKTTCVVVNSIYEADFVIELRVIKKGMAIRSAMIAIKHIGTGKEVLETKWVKGANTIFYGYSGSRAAIQKVVDKYLLKNYPKIKI